MTEQLDYNDAAELERASVNISKLNACQKQVHDQILNSALAKDAQGRQCGSLFFVNGPGGTGKSFMCTLLGIMNKQIHACPECTTPLQ